MTRQGDLRQRASTDRRIIHSWGGRGTARTCLSPAHPHAHVRGARCRAGRSSAAAARPRVLMARAQHNRSSERLGRLQADGKGRAIEPHSSTQGQTDCTAEREHNSGRRCSDSGIGRTAVHRGGRQHEQGITRKAPRSGIHPTRARVVASVHWPAPFRRLHPCVCTCLYVWPLSLCCEPPSHSRA